MKKSDLKTGMIIESRKGEKALVVKDNCYGEDAIIYNKSDWTQLDSFSDDLKFYGDDEERTQFSKSVDIVKVFMPNLPTAFLDKEDMKLIWTRKEEKPIVKLDGVEYSESTLRSLIKKATK